MGASNGNGIKVYKVFDRSCDIYWNELICPLNKLNFYKIINNK